MPTGICKNCHRLTNSATSIWGGAWDNNPEKCYMALEGDIVVKGCAFEEAPTWIRKMVLDLIIEQPYKNKLEVGLEEGE